MDNEYEPPRQRKKPKVKESVIDHTYRDYSQVEVSSDEEGAAGAADDKKQSRLQPNFPAKLHAIVSNPNYDHIISWQPHGRSWKIVDKHLLSTVICPKHFAHAKFESFNRSVNGWGFKRLLNPGPDCKSYYHECFLRGRPELTKLMQRLVNPGKRLPDKAGEPDFYEISRKYPLPPAPTSAPDDLPEAPPQAQRPGQQGRFNIQAAQAAGGYPYGYYQPGFAQPPFPPQPPPQQAYWPNQLPPTMYPPNPTAYGYYPYPQMMVPQGYEQYPHPSMYGQYYPGAPTPTAAAAYAPSPGRAKPAAQAQQQPSIDPEQFYQAAPPPETHDSPTESDAGAEDDRKPPAQPDPAGGQPSLPTAPHDSESATETSARDVVASYDPSQQQPLQQQQQLGGASGNTSSEGPNSTSSERRTRTSSKPEEGGDGINEQQLLQDFFQHF
ncbi:hypothetical protein ACHAXH_001044 [Discostella pseudostelligera]